MNPITKLPLTVTPMNANKFQTWITNRGGLAVWESKLIGEPFRSWTTPACKVDGTPTPPVDWRVGNEPTLVITDMKDVVVEIPKEVAHYHDDTHSPPPWFSSRFTRGYRLNRCSHSSGRMRYPRRAIAAALVNFALNSVGIISSDPKSPS